VRFFTAWLENFLKFIIVCTAMVIVHIQLPKRVSDDCDFAVNNVCRRVKEQAMNLHEPMRAILPLQSAIRKLQPSSEYLTAIHADFLQVCLLSKCYKASLSILEDDIFEIDQKRTALVPRDFLLYCYYGYASDADVINAKFSSLFADSSTCCVQDANCRGRSY
jgi:hypothetical protein